MSRHSLSKHTSDECYKYLKSLSQLSSSNKIKMYGKVGGMYRLKRDVYVNFSKNHYTKIKECLSPNEAFRVSVCNNAYLPIAVKFS